MTLGAGYTSTTTGENPSSPGAGNAGSSSPPVCQWVPVQGMTSNPGGISAPEGPTGPESSIAPGTAGTWYQLTCPTRPINFGDVTLFVPAGQSAGNLVSPQVLAEEAENELQLPAPPVQLSPMPSARQWEFVNVPTWAWLDPSAWKPLQASAAAGPVAVIATATPEQIRITYQDDSQQSTVTCTGPGTAYSDALAKSENPLDPLRAASPDCGWTYRHSSAAAAGELEPVSATVSYHVTWTVTGAPGGGDLGTLTSPATSYQVKVGEVQALVNSSS